MLQLGYEDIFKKKKGKSKKKKGRIAFIACTNILSEEEKNARKRE